MIEIHARLAAIVGSMSIGIAIGKGSRRVLQEWVKSLRAIADELEHKLGG